MNRRYLQNNKGFTLVELMVTLFLTAIAVVAIYRGYTSFSQAADAQQQMMEMQQNLRIGMYTLVKDVMRAGMKEEDDTVVAFALAGTSEVILQMDLGSGGVFATDGVDNDRDGLKDDDPDAAVAAREKEEESRVGDGAPDDDGERIRYTVVDEKLLREVWDGGTGDFDPPQTIIVNVSALEFLYIPVDSDTPIDMPEDDAAVLATIDRVEITLVVRTTNEDYRIANNEIYRNLRDGEVLDMSAAPDNFRRRSMSMRVKVRNAQL